MLLAMISFQANVSNTVWGVQAEQGGPQKPAGASVEEYDFLFGVHAAALNPILSSIDSTQVRLLGFLSPLHCMSDSSIVSPVETLSAASCPLAGQSRWASTGRLATLQSMLPEADPCSCTSALS